MPFDGRSFTLSACLFASFCLLINNPATAQPQDEAFKVVAQWNIDIVMREYPADDQITEYRISEGGAVSSEGSGKPVRSVPEEIEYLVKHDDNDVVLFGKPKIRAGDFLKTYAAFDERLKGRVRFGGLAELHDTANFSNPQGNHLGEDTLKLLGRINGFRHFAYVRSGTRHRCDTYLNVVPTDRMELLKRGHDLRNYLDQKGEPSDYRLTLFVDPQSDYQCLGSAIYTLLFTGFTSFSMELVEQAEKK